MKEYKTYTLEELSIGKGSYGIAASAVPFNSSLHTYLRITDINDDGSLNKTGLMSVDEDDAEKYLLKPNDIVFARTGNSTGRSYFYDGSDGDLVYAGFLIKFSLDSTKVNPRILKYYTHSKPYYDWVRSFGTGSTRGNINAKTYGNMPITLPPRELQDKIVAILKSLDDKIEVNRRINENLEQQAQALFKSWFVDFEQFKDQPFVESELGMIPQGWRVQESQDVFTINIGKTPPRKEPEWFSESSEDNIWVSIADMGSCGTFISDSSEYLTNDAIERFNVQMVEKDSVLLSFKLTVGRVAIAGTRLTTNEAIARFILPEKFYREFLYLYLKQYKYKNLGSTSSIATAVNSKTIKGMKLLMPKVEVIKYFSNKTRPLFEQIRFLQKESRRLAELRDTLLPRLMSGEIRVTNMDLVNKLMENNVF